MCGCVCSRLVSKELYASIYCRSKKFSWISGGCANPAYQKKKMKIKMHDMTSE